MELTNELGAYLRARRAEISPVDAGVADDGERRVPGLRREEVALLAGLSVDYYARLEQGRERRPSEQVIDALPRVLHLDAHGIHYLATLAAPAPRRAASTFPGEAGPGIIELLDVVDTPAIVVGPALDILATNPLARALYRGFARIDNLARMVFLDPRARMFYEDWEEAARSTVANLRALSSPFPDDPRVREVVGDLTLRSPAFASSWSRHEVRPRTSGIKDLLHPEVGRLALRYQTFAVSESPGHHLFVYTAAAAGPNADALVLLRAIAGATGAEPPPTGSTSVLETDWETT